MACEVFEIVELTLCFADLALKDVDGFVGGHANIIGVKIEAGCRRFQLPHIFKGLSEIAEISFLGLELRPELFCLRCVPGRILGHGLRRRLAVCLFRGFVDWLADNRN